MGFKPASRGAAQVGGGEQCGEEIRIPSLTRRTNRDALRSLLYTVYNQQSTVLYIVPDFYSRVSGSRDAGEFRVRIPAPAPCQISDASRLTPTGTHHVGIPNRAFIFFLDVVTALIIG